MGSTPSVQKNVEAVIKYQQKPIQVIHQLKNDSILKEIINNQVVQPQILKASQSVNIQKTKNEAKVKKVKDVRSLQSIKNIKLYNNQNENYLADVGADEIQDVTVNKKVIKQLNPLNKKKLASDRVLLQIQSKTQNVITNNTLMGVNNHGDFQGRTKRCRVSRML